MRAGAGEGATRAALEALRLGQRNGGGGGGGLSFADPSVVAWFQCREGRGRRIRHLTATGVGPSGPPWFFSCGDAEQQQVIPMGSTRFGLIPGWLWKRRHGRFWQWSSRSRSDHPYRCDSWPNAQGRRRMRRILTSGRVWVRGRWCRRYQRWRTSERRGRGRRLCRTARVHAVGRGWRRWGRRRK